jgi:hypothetical protein
MQKCRENVFQLTVGNESLHQDGNDNDFRIVNFATSKIWFLRTMFPHRNIHKCTRISPDGKTHNQIDHVLIGDGIRIYSMYDLLGVLTEILITVWWLQKLGKIGSKYTSNAEV